tara:strand:- start:1296 stop:2504 length:1209 start_codon:yes stop_codon:yes gene_type:complete
MLATTYDFVVVGAGIVGLTVARELMLRDPSASVAILDKEENIGAHASGRNSGVLHCGIFYGSDTLKAKVCSQGATRMAEFASENGIPYLKSGKVILATSEQQLPVIERLMFNARENGINAQRINEQELYELEPAATPGPAAIYCPDTAVINSVAVLKQLRLLLEQQGVVFLFGWQVKGLKASNKIETTQGILSYGFLYNCAGAHADTLARHYGLAQDYALIPFKGIYWKLSKEADHLVRANIYPVPDVSLPFLGIHLTRIINGDVYVGPTAIPALGRENYGKIKGIHLSEALTIGGHLASMYLGNKNNFRLLAHTEMEKYSKNCFLSAARKLVPVLQENHLVPTLKSGIRPQLINVKTKKIEMDYIFEQTNNSMHVLNTISPAFTSSFAFAEMIVDQSQENL